MHITSRASYLLIAAVPALLGACTAPNPGSGPGPGAVAGTAQPATGPTLGQEVAAVVDNKVVVTFPQGGTALTPSANRQLDLAARLFRDANPVLMFTSGYASRDGSEYGNLIVSARRAQAVKQGLVARGIPADRLLIQAFGQSEPADPENPLAAENRRVVITWRLL